ncbi:hypothetical protein BH11PLA1_BH11PLA1_16140 [soil metagenome]
MPSLGIGLAASIGLALFAHVRRRRLSELARRRRDQRAFGYNPPKFSTLSPGLGGIWVPFYAPPSSGGFPPGAGS